MAPGDSLPSKPWSVYLIRRCDGALYAGIAVDVAARLRRHEAGAGSKALRGRGPLELVFSTTVGDRASAQRIEARLKRLPKAEKERLLAVPSGFAMWLDGLGMAPTVSGSVRVPQPQPRRRIVRGWCVVTRQTTETREGRSRLAHVALDQREPVPPR